MVSRIAVASGSLELETSLICEHFVVIYPLIIQHSHG